MSLWRVGGGVMVVDGLPSPGDRGGGDAVDPVMGGPPSGPLAIDLGARVRWPTLGSLQ
jgi:hypothetical protein